MGRHMRAMVHPIGGLAVLVLALALAEMVKRGFGLAVPEPVLAVILLVGGFIWLGRVPQGVRQVSQILLPHMALFFIPALVGLMALSDMLAAIILPLMLIIIVSTLLPLWLTAWLFQKYAPPLNAPSTSPVQTSPNDEAEEENAH